MIRHRPALLVLTAAALFAYLLSITPAVVYFPQIIAALTLIFFSLHLHPDITRLTHLSLGFITFTICFIVFATHGVTSPLFFLIYFLLFTLAFQYPPLLTLTFASILVLILSQSLNSLNSLLPLLSLLFIAPLAWFVAQEHADNLSLSRYLSSEETNTIFWLSLKFKNTILKIIDTTAHLLSDPRLTPSQKNQLQAVHKHSQSLLSSSKSLIDDFQSANEKS